ncbi:hypothetical protein SDC9_46859 [bioreactor metagenome]|uniref:Terminase large subunit gp17-like C-terminal domain-containing protein n=1 Tax=bioreactor metagenome TaxID=1076179 RepID=A0A644WAX9_9ZZZZ
MTKPIKQTDKQAVIDWKSYFENYIASVKANQNESKEEKKKRIARLEANFEDWKQYYFPKYCFAPSAKFHKEAAKRELANEEWYEVHMWARELAKDVTEMMVTLYQALTGIKRNILFISNSWDKAAELLEPYRINLERNERIISDYGVQAMPGSWTYGDFVTTGNVSFLAVGAGQSPRGSRNEEVRPDKVIVSDIDTDEDVRNQSIVDKRWEWFEKAVYPTRSISKPTQYIFLGNKIANECCITKAADKADFVSTVNIVDKNGQSTWPEKNSQENIERIRKSISVRAWEGEYMNNPVSEGKVFTKMVWGECPDLRKLKQVVAYGDPGTSNKAGKGSSFKGVFIVGEYDHKYYVYTGFLDRVGSAAFVEWYYACEDYTRDKTQLLNYVENNSLQDPFYEQVFKPLFSELAKKRGYYLLMRGDNRKKPDKFVRIEGNLEPLNRNGQLILNIKEKDNPHMKQLEAQFKTIEEGLPAPADGPDCIEGAVMILRMRKAQDVSKLTLGMRPKNSPNKF